MFYCIITAKVFQFSIILGNREGDGLDEATSISVLVLVVALCLLFLSNLLAKKAGLLCAGKVINFIVYVDANHYKTILFRKVLPEPKLMSPFWSYRESLAFGGSSVIRSLLTGNVTVINTRLLKEIILNVLLYVPLGYLLPFVWPKIEKKRIIVLIGFLCSSLTEAVQYFFQIGWCELDDIVGNTLGCFLGCMIDKLIIKKHMKSS